MREQATGQQRDQPSTPAGSLTLIELGQQLERESRRCTRLYRKWQRAAVLAGQLCAERGIPSHLPDGRINPQAEAVKDEVGATRLRRQWREALVTSLRTARLILRLPAGDLPGLSTHYQALLWRLFHTGMEISIDPLHLRHLRSFGRELRGSAEAPE